MMPDFATITLEYDAAGDVLYVGLSNSEVATKGVEDEGGLILRYGADGKLVGVTALDFTVSLGEQRWLLAERLGRALRLAPSQTDRLLRLAAAKARSSPAVLHT